MVLVMIPLSHKRQLEAKAKELGAINAWIIQAKEIVVEERTILKCIFGCDGWGSHVCPPFIPTVGEFQNMLKEYAVALLVEWDSNNVMTKETSENFIMYQFSPPKDPKSRERHRRAIRAIMSDRKDVIQPGSLALEKEAWKLGYNMALATFPGKCMWCATPDFSVVSCTGARGECHHPTMRRPCMMGLGIRLDKTISMLGMELPPYPLDEVVPKQYTIIFID
jgi:predicted metal-binding protein